MEIEKQAQPEPTAEQLRKAEEGLIQLLSAKHFTGEWIERQVPEAMAQAQADLATRIAAGRKDETVGLLIVIAYRRALKALSAERSKPRSVSVEEVFDLVDEYARTPEQIVMEGDRQARLLRAMHYLPDREKELLGLVYYGELDVKEAGRRLGWSSSSAERHHKEALVKLRALVGERSLLGADVAVPALIASDYSIPKPGLHHWLEATADRGGQLAGWALQHSHSIAEGGGAVGMTGAGRTSAWLWGLAVAVCVVAMVCGAMLRVGGIQVLQSGGPQRHSAADQIGRMSAARGGRRSDGLAPAAPSGSSAPAPPRSDTATGAELWPSSRERRTGGAPRIGEAKAVTAAPEVQASDGLFAEGDRGSALPQPTGGPSPTEPSLALPRELAPAASAKSPVGIEEVGCNGLACVRCECKAPNSERALPGAGQDLG